MAAAFSLDSDCFTMSLSDCLTMPASGDLTIPVSGCPLTSGLHSGTSMCKNR